MGNEEGPRNPTNVDSTDAMGTSEDTNYNVIYFKV